MIEFFGKTFKQTMLYIILAELLSFLGYFFPNVNTAAFFAIVIITFVLSLKNLETGIFIMFAELFIGSLGKLFYFEYGGFSISVRVALWLVVMSVWLGKLIMEFIKTKKISIKEFLNFGYVKYFLILFIFIAWGIVNGFINNNGFGNILFDANSWFYFLLIFPMYAAFKKDFEKKFPIILQIFFASALWLSFKTLFLLFIFSHNMTIMLVLYPWVRDSGIGEITRMGDYGNFYRLFFQSHIYVLISYCLFLILAAKNKLRERNFLNYYLLLILFGAVDIINLSRSNWVGLSAGVILIIVFVFWKFGFKKLLYLIFIGLTSLAISIFLIFIIIKFPYPKPSTDFSLNMFSKRATEINEAGASSRWSLLDKLWPEIKSAPISGKGFGATVSYKSSDPRVLMQTTDGIYTTFAFEWGWLDIWLKLGFFGLASYLFLIFIIIRDAFIYFKNRIELSDIDLIKINFVIGLVVIGCIHFFSPYLGHPLGVGYVLLASFLLLMKNKEKII